jgi:hypothetical protein
MIPTTIEEFIAWADRTPAVTWNHSGGVKDLWRQLQAEQQTSD